MFNLSASPGDIAAQETGIISAHAGDNLHLRLGMNETEDHEDEEMKSLSYRIVATVLLVVILIGGLFGNVVLILMARRTRSLQTPTYCYLVSLAFADLIVLLSAIPEAILYTHLHRYVLGQAGCSLLIFGNFLGINAGSLSILAFTVERYIAVLRPLLAQKVCTVGRAKKIIIGVWILSLIYCAPWLFLTKVYPDQENPDIESCDFRVTKEQYVSFFMTDLVLFYCIPLIFAATVYSMIAWTVKKSRDMKASRAELMKINSSEVTLDGLSATVRSSGRTPSPVAYTVRSSCRKNTKTQALPMLIVVVVLFAVCWLPFRGLLVYNSLAPKPWLDTWYLLFAKTLIYVNSAINPFLYNFMSRRFREAVFHFLGIHARRSVSIRSDL